MHAFRNTFSSDAGRRSRRALGLVFAAALAVPAVMAIAPSGVGAATYCPGMALTLSGGTSPTDQMPVDDDLEVRLNGTQIYLDSDSTAGYLPTLSFTAKAGDQLRIIATNAGGPEQAGPFYLHCDANGAQQVLDPDMLKTDGEPGVFYDKTFTVDFTAEAPTTAPPTTAPPTQPVAEPVVVAAAFTG